MIMQAEDKKYYTAEEYLDFEFNSEQRHEYINGEIVCWIKTEVWNDINITDLDSFILV